MAVSMRWITFASDLHCSRIMHKCNLQFVRSRYRRRDTPLPDPELAQRLIYGNREYMEREKFPGEFATELPYGKIYDKKPMKLFLEAGKEYLWCSCGTSKGQPICDGAHKRLDGSEFIKTKPLFRPFSFKVDVSGDYYLCNCKQSSNRPFCDGTHKRKDIQEAIKN